MKKVISSVLLSTLFVSIAAFADDVDPKKVRDIPACSALSAQCEAAGFMPGAHKKNGKGLWADCIGAKAKGKEVTGVSFSADEAKGCVDAAKPAREEMKAQREAKKEERKARKAEREAKKAEKAAQGSDSTTEEKK